MGLQKYFEELSFPQMEEVVRVADICEENNLGLVGLSSFKRNKVNLYVMPSKDVHASEIDYALAVSDLTKRLKEEGQDYRINNSLDNGLFDVASLEYAVENTIIKFAFPRNVGLLKELGVDLSSIGQSYIDTTRNENSQYCMASIPDFIFK